MPNIFDERHIYKTNMCILTALLFDTSLSVNTSLWTWNFPFEIQNRNTFSRRYTTVYAISLFFLFHFFISIKKELHPRFSHLRTYVYIRTYSHSFCVNTELTEHREKACIE